MSIKSALGIDAWDGSTVLGVLAGITVVAAASVLTVGAHLWAATGGTDQVLPWNPAQLVSDLVTGRLQAGGSLWAWVAATALVPIATGLVARRLVRGRGVRRRSRVDSAARRTGSAAETRALSHKAVAAKAQRLGVEGTRGGLSIARAVRTGAWLWSDFEQVCLMIAGPRTNKTTGWVVPRIIEAPGAVLATSNKRDLVDLTRARRRQAGRDWVFDPEDLTGEGQKWWWNIMSFVTSPARALKLTNAFVDATRDPRASTNAYFDAAARDLVAALLLAAAHSGQPITILHRWLTLQSDDPVSVLREAGEHMMADTLQGTLQLVPETRSGVYGSASTIMSFLVNAQATSWVTPSPWLQELRLEDFVRSRDTLYCLSEEKRGSTAPIITALTAAVVEAALEHAKTQASGRLAVPMLIELDEAANVCPWRGLPDLYSHFGSRGLLVDTLLQSWSQGVATWGEEGIRRLWSAANARLVAGGLAEKSFLADVSEMIGSYWQDSRQVSYSQQGRSSSVGSESQQRQIATVADLTGLPPGRGWLLSSGSPAVLVEIVPFWQRQGMSDLGKEK